MPRPNQKETLMLLAILLFGLIVRTYGISRPDHAYFDEKYYVSAAQDYLEGRPDDNSVHPPLAKIQIAAGMLLLDGLKAYHLNPLPDTVSWRFASVVSGMGVLVLGFYLALAVSGSVRLSLFALFLLATDFLQVVQSRVTMLDQVQDFWMTAGIFVCAYAIFVWPKGAPGPGDASGDPGGEPVDRAPIERRSSWGWLTLIWIAGICFGAATACKWNGLFAATSGVLALTFVPQENPHPRWSRFLLSGLIFAVSIAVVYSLSYTPFLIREWHTPPSASQSEDDDEATAVRHGDVVSKILTAGAPAAQPAKARPTQAFTKAHPPAPVAHRDKIQFLRDSVKKIVGFHKRMWDFRYDKTQFKHRYLSQFYQWPLVMRPIWYFYEDDREPGYLRGIIALGSPVFWWAAAILWLELFVNALRGLADRAGCFLLLTYLPMWLLWASSTTGGFLYYMLPTTPLMAIVVARELERWWQDPASVKYAVIYLCLIQLAFTVYYPFMAGLPVPSGALHKLFFDRWI